MHLKTNINFEPASLRTYFLANRFRFVAWAKKLKQIDYTALLNELLDNGKAKGIKGVLELCLPLKATAITRL
jgi:hypothetical protein